MHCRNEVKQEIITFKDHFSAGLCSIDPYFPMQKRDRLVEQVEITLNLLHPSMMNPKLLAYSQLNGTFDYNRTPMNPPQDLEP